MEFNVINFSNKDSWKEIIKEKEIYYQWEYIDAFYKNGDGEPFLVYAKHKDNYVFNVCLKRDISSEKQFKQILTENTYFDISTPYGYGGVDIIGNKDDELLKYYFNEFYRYCKVNNIISEFVRLNPLTDNYELYRDTDYEIINIAKTIYIKLESEEQIWNDMESKCRNKIRKAEKNGLIVKTGYDEKMFKEFVKLYIETMKRDNAEEYYFFKPDFFESIYNNLKDYATIYTTYLDDKPINSILVIFCGNNVHYHLSGTDSAYMNLGANNLTLYKIAVDMQKKEYKKFHLGGGYGGDQSPLLTFKKAFNKNGLLDFYIGKKIFDEGTYKKLVELRTKEKEFSENSSFFPLYRA